MPTDRRLFLALLATLLLLFLCLLPSAWMPVREETSKGITHLDKVAHFAMFAGCAWLWASAGRGLSRGRAVAVLLASTALAFGTEWLQGHPMIHRDPDILDSLADLVGACAGIGFAGLLKGVRRPLPHAVSDVGV